MFGFGHTPETKDIPFDTLCQATARTALVVLRHAGYPPTVRTLRLLLASAPQTPAEVRDPCHRHGSFCRDCLERAVERVSAQDSLEDKDAVREARLVFLTILPTTTPATRRLVETAVLTLAPVFSRSPVAEAVAS